MSSKKADTVPENPIEIRSILIREIARKEALETNLAMLQGEMDRFDSRSKGDNFLVKIIFLQLVAAGVVLFFLSQWWQLG